jgi:Beta propeller domain
MPNRRSVLSHALCASLLLPSLGACANPFSSTAQSSATLAAYRSEAELSDALARWRSQAEKLRGEARRGKADSSMALGQSAPATAPATAPLAAAKSADSAGPSGTAAAAESITNVQTAGVDEGGIVKRAGDHLVILRRGRLFTVRVGGDALLPVSHVDAYAPGSHPQGAWYDELLISESTVVVIGYSYARGGTEIGLFDLGRDGALSYRATYHLRSFDYYSSRNYASRLIGRKLVFYTPTLLHPWGQPHAQMFPALRRWHGDAVSSGFERILPATRVYRTDDEFDPHQPLALHSVTSCDLGAGSGANLRCESSAVLGPAGRVFYVSQGSVYVWTSGAPRRPVVAQVYPPLPQPPAQSLSAVFRIPLDGAAPSAIKTAGVPIDQMSFLEDERGHLNVLLREAGAGEGMWGGEHTRGGLALLRVPLAAFGDGRGAAQREHYRALPAVRGHALHNRFVGGWLVWGGEIGGRRGPAHDGMAPGTQYESPQEAPQAEPYAGRDRRYAANAWALRYAESHAPQPLHPGHAVERIEAMGSDVVLVGNAGADLHFSSVRLGAADASLAARHVQSNASQGETRTHGFFYRATGRDAGLLGLPVLGGAGSRRHGVYAAGQGAASVVFLRQRDLAFTALGELQARGGAAVDDQCKASCVDWYGNARPIFMGERIFALLGYELIEGSLMAQAWGERIDERRRVNFAPHAAMASVREGRYSPFSN